MLCLDADGRFPPADELSMLARVKGATSIEVGSIRARSALAAALEGAAVSAPVEPVITAFSDCSGACDGRVVVGSAP